ncbi:hypothetical protein VCHC70A1_0009 [Vibrio cholerae HC-70A1]|nr:hypothetical protein VCLMA_A0009 [Vibrio cholerae LMA3984-4]APF47639.1 hypothetical protein ASZ80_00009 [Vibrio cholerae]EET90962.1 hypothetical protein VCH_003204 [Vibrio cholerae CIRS101]EEY48980.1 hypothetical protein VIG_001102 [Vibrio cholerae INDRE 91/1]EGR05173.1 hypothetical protein VCHE39_0035 [Vibrio cholerae HE39]EGR06952.1 hypothetical protein VCHCUF01_0033 [Vibrio cholerae HCUF01]EGR07134.1 hypothetical protein VCHC49A2_0033 [Vibrio cholerae HC-49A2]EGR10700.1 hypothetical pr
MDLYVGSTGKMCEDLSYRSKNNVNNLDLIHWIDDPALAI